MAGVLKPQDIKKVLVARSERVKMVDLHPKEPLVVASLFSGQVTIWNYDTQTMLKSFEISDQPIRCVKFIARMQCFACGADDYKVRIYNYNTMEKVQTFEAHPDYIRSLAVHDQLPYLLTASDDMTVKLWDWSKGWANTLTFEGHAHYVMQVTFNPKDPSTFATASLDETIKVWSVTNAGCNFTLEGHEKGVNTVEYYQAGDKPYLVSGSDDHTVRVWDYQTKACIQVLSHHSHNVPCAYFYSELPLLITGSEDETIGVFNTQTWRQEHTLNYGLQRIWSIHARGGRVAIGCDKGLVILRLGRDEPCISMDSAGKIVYTNNQEVLGMAIKGIAKEVADGDPLLLQTKSIGTCENVPQKMLHGPSGQYIAFLSEGEYTINSSLGLRPKVFGPAIDFVWGGGDNGSYAILENSTTLKVHRSFKLRETIKLPFAADALFGGPLLGIRVEGSVLFYDWEKFRTVRKVDITPKDLQWSDSGELLALLAETGTFVLKYNSERVAAHLEAGAPVGPDGLDFCFDIVEELDERVRQAQWVADCLVFVNHTDRLNYYIGGEVTSVAVLPRPMHLLGFLAKESRVILVDKERVVVSFQLFLSVIEYKTAIVREDLEAAAAVLPNVPEVMRYKVAQFLQARGHLQLAMEVTTEDDHKFDLAVQLGCLPVCVALARQAPSQARWKQVGDLALERAFFDLAEEALGQAGDDAGLLLLFTSTGDAGKLAALGTSALARGKSNVAFSCFHLTGAHDACIDVLVQTGKVAEAALYARTYRHSRVDELVAKWRREAADRAAAAAAAAERARDVEAAKAAEARDGRLAALRAAENEVAARMATRRDAAVDAAIGGSLGGRPAVAASTAAELRAAEEALRMRIAARSAAAAAHAGYAAPPYPSAPVLAPAYAPAPGGPAYPPVGYPPGYPPPPAAWPGYPAPPAAAAWAPPAAAPPFAGYGYAAPPPPPGPSAVPPYPPPPPGGAGSYAGAPAPHLPTSYGGALSAVAPATPGGWGYALPPR